MSKPRQAQIQVRPLAGMRQVNPRATGVDIGAQEIVVCVGGKEGDQLVRTFGTYTVDLRAVAQ